MRLAHVPTFKIADQARGVVTVSNIVRLCRPHLDDQPADWRDIALCRQVDPEIFYPPKGQSLAPAKQICGACDVRQACLEDALATRDCEFGVRAGLAASARRRILTDAHRNAVADVLAAAAA
jgi:WhiB family redox-sensing transcriptional regulator